MMTSRSSKVMMLTFSSSMTIRMVVLPLGRRLSLLLIDVD